MPFASKSQAGFMFAHHPKIAERFAKETPNMKSLPEHVESMAEGGMICRHCGGSVGEDGLAEMAAEMTSGDSEEADNADVEAVRSRAFADSIGRGKR